MNNETVSENGIAAARMILAAELDFWNELTESQKRQTSAVAAEVWAKAYRDGKEFAERWLEEAKGEW